MLAEMGIRAEGACLPASVRRAAHARPDATCGVSTVGACWPIEDPRSSIGGRCMHAPGQGRMRPCRPNDADMFKRCSAGDARWSCGHSRSYSDCRCSAPVGSRAAALAAKPKRRSGHAPAKTPPAEVTLPPSPAGAGVTVTMAPVGLSLEYPTMAQDLGTGACPPPALVSELQALGSPPLALAGDSQDSTAPSGALSGTPASWETATLYALPATFWSELHCLLSATRDPLTVGLNAKTRQTRVGGADGRRRPERGHQRPELLARQRARPVLPAQLRLAEQAAAR